MMQQQEYQCSWCKRNKFNGDESCPLNLEGSNGNSDIFDGMNRVIKSCGCGSFIDTRRSPAPQQPERYTGVCAVQDKCMEYSDFIESIEEELTEDDMDPPCPIKCDKRVNPHPPAPADAVLGAYIADILEAVKIMRSESATVKGDANKTREKVYHDGALFAYDRMQQYLERKAALRAREQQK